MTKLKKELNKSSGFVTPLSLAEMFHREYERLAPKFGYETRDSTKKFDPNSPNGQLMIETCKSVLENLYRKSEDEFLKEIDNYFKNTSDEQIRNDVEAIHKQMYSITCIDVDDEDEYLNNPHTIQKCWDRYNKLIDEGKISKPPNSMKCKKDLFMNDTGEKRFTKGRWYDVIDKWCVGDNFDLFLIDDTNNQHIISSEVLFDYFEEEEE